MEEGRTIGNHKALTSVVAAVASIATLGALAAPAFAVDAANGTYSPNGKSVAELAKHGAAQRIAAIGNKSAKNVVLFIGDGMGDSENHHRPRLSEGRQRPLRWSGRGRSARRA